MTESRWSGGEGRMISPAVHAAVSATVSSNDFWIQLRITERVYRIEIRRRCWRWRSKSRTRPRKLSNVNPAETPAEQPGRQGTQKRQTQQKAHEPRDVERRLGLQSARNQTLLDCGL